MSATKAKSMSNDTGATIHRLPSAEGGEVVSLFPDAREADETPPAPEVACYADDYDDEHATDAAPRVRYVDPDEWRKRLTRTKQGNPKSDSANTTLILTHHPKWTGLLAYDAFRECIVKTRAPEWDAIDHPAGDFLDGSEWTDNDTGRLVNWLSRAEGISVKPGDAEHAVAIAADVKRAHPVRDYLRGVTWDAKQRLPSLLSDYFGAEPSEYTEAIGVRFMIGAVARIFLPGCQVDTTIVLESPQGWRKTSAFREIVPERWMYSDSGIEIGSKDSYQNLRGVWIYGLDELDSMRGKEVTRVKSFLTATRDRYRPSFARRARDFARQNVFVGSTNEDQYLGDTTGNRRFWPVRLVRPVDVEAIARDRDQLWAEARTRFESGEKWHVDTPELRALCEAEQGKRVISSVWEAPISAWLANPIKVDADGNRTGTVNVSAGVSVSDVLTHGLRKRPGDWRKSDEMEAAKALKSLGWTRDAHPTTRAGERVRLWRPAN